MVDRLNRVVLGILGAVTAGLGAVAVLAADGRIDLDSPGTLFRRLRADAAAEPRAWLAGIVGASLVVLLLALAWAWVQIRGRHDGPPLGTVVVGVPGRGQTTLEPSALARAVGRDLATLPGVAGARVRFLELDPRPRLVVVLDLDADVDPEQVVRSVDEPIRRLAGALQVPAIDADVGLRPTAAVRRVA